MKRLLLRGGTVITPFEEVAADVLVEGGRIAAVAPGLAADGAEVVDVTGRLVAPGTIDLHIQGHEGRDLWEGTYESVNAVSAALPKHGVTGMAATTYGFERFISPVVEAIERGVDGAGILGIHSEGPFVNPRRPGAIEAESILPLSLDALKRLIDMGRGHIRIMTIAPELPGALEAIAFLARSGVRASLGHSTATFDEAQAGFDAGAARVTHLFNAMTSFADRADGGLAAAALLRADVAVEVVSDCVHVHPAMIRMVRGVKGPRLTSAVTDSVKVAGLPPGHYRSGGHGGDVYVREEGDPPRLADGTIAGSSLSMDSALRRLVRVVGLSRTDAFTMAAFAPAAVLGLAGQKGEIAPGRDADIVVYNLDLEVERTYIRGELKHKSA